MTLTLLLPQHSSLLTIRRQRVPVVSPRRDILDCTRKSTSHEIMPCQSVRAAKAKHWRRIRSQQREGFPTTIEIIILRLPGTEAWTFGGPSPEQARSSNGSRRSVLHLLAGHCKGVSSVTQASVLVNTLSYYLSVATDVSAVVAHDAVDWAERDEGSEDSDEPHQQLSGVGR